MNDQQCEIADKVLRAILRYGGRCNIDQFYWELPDYDDRTMDYETTISALEYDYELIRFEGQDRYYVALTAEGRKTAQTGMSKRLTKEHRKAWMQEKKLTIDLINGVFTLGNFVAAVIGFTAGILLADPVKGLLRTIFGF